MDYHRSRTFVPRCLITIVGIVALWVPAAQAQYTTIITHGFQPPPFGSLPGWALEMGERIADRMGTASVYQYNSHNGDWIHHYDPPSGGSTNSIVLVFDWAVESDGLNEGFRNWKYADAAGDALYAALRDPAGALAGVDLLGLPSNPSRVIHIIGHSRGCSVNSEAVRLLTLAGIPVDHVTTLDPHPVDGFLDGGFGSWGDTTPVTYDDVTWADNYWRRDLDPTDFDGISLMPNVDFEQRLGGSLLDDLLAGQGYLLEHQDTHLWYHGTIDLTAAAFDGSQAITTTMRMPPPIGWYLNAGANEGFSHAAVLGGSRNPNADGHRMSPMEGPILLNGTFDLGGNDTVAGWHYHGGYVNVIPQLRCEGNNCFIRISHEPGLYGQELGGALVHNRFFLPSNAGVVEFKYRVTTEAPNESLRLVFWNNNGAGEVAGLVSLGIGTITPGFVRKSFVINPSQVTLGQTYTMGVFNDDSADIDAVVDVDDFAIRLRPVLDRVVTRVESGQAEPGEQILVDFRVNNPDLGSQDLFLGASIRAVSGGPTISSSDCEGCGIGALVTIPGKTSQTFSRCFTIPPSALPGLYEVCYRLRMVSGCSGGAEYDSFCSNDLTIGPPSGGDHIILAQAGPNGSISPNGPLSVPDGNCATFTASPNTDYVVDTWYRDGVEVQDGGTSYTICPTQNHSLTVQFRYIGPPSGMFSVLDPNGGEVFCAGDRMKISWERIPDCSEVSIELIQGSSVNQVISSSRSNYGEHTWRIPSNQAPGANYKIRVSCVTSSAEDESNDFFAITAPCDPPPIIAIRTLSDLRSLSENWGDSQHPANGHYVLMNDIDADSSSTWNGGNGMMPLGPAHDYFRGTFDGQGYTISELHIEWEDMREVGLFSVVGRSATIKNLVLEDVFVRGNGSVGAVAGLGGGDIMNCHVTGLSDIRSTDTDPTDAVGGLVGDNHRGLIRNCSISGETEVRGYSDEVGGIVGLHSPGLVIWCSADSLEQVRSYGNEAGGVVGANYDRVVQSYSDMQRVRAISYAGGVVGRNGGYVSDCFSLSPVEGSNNLGGIVGENENLMEHCLGTGNVENESVAGGLVGVNRSAVAEAFWDTQATGRSQPGGGGAGTFTDCHGLTTVELRKQATYTTTYGAYWDFENIWWIEEDVDYPKLCGVGDLLPIPVNLTASTGMGQGVFLQWSPVSYEGDCGPFYRVLRADDIDTAKLAISDWQPGSSFVDTTAIPGHTYYYWVSAAATTYAYDDPYDLYEDPYDPTNDILAARESGLSNYATGSRTDPPPDSPTGVSATDGLVGFISISWDAVTGADSYRVYRADAIDGMKVVICDGPTGPPCVDSTVTADATYYYWATATNANGESLFSSPDTGRSDCANSSQCEDGSYCNGQETCQSGTCVQGAPPCSDMAHCDDVGDTCICLNSSECDDSNYCNGAETCDANGVCQPGAPIVCNDSVTCTLDVCNEDIQDCEYIPIDAGCDNGAWCDGLETCDETLGCQPGVPPVCDDSVSCTVDSCNEFADTCGFVASNGLCDDGDYCNGNETCDPILDCQPGTLPCIDLAHCDDDIDACICADDSECDDGIDCTTNSCNTQGFCDYILGPGYCLIADVCYAATARNPMNECQECDPTANTSGWSFVMSGVPCGDPADSICDNPDTCDGAGTCNPNWEMDDMPCTDDGDFCNGDEVCQSGDCMSTGISPCGACARCDPNLGCVADPDPCCGSSDPCCGSTDPCCGNPNPCCGNPNPCCGNPNPCCGSTDLCCGVDCDDNNLCTTDTCNNGTCRHNPVGCEPGRTCEPATGTCVPNGSCCVGTSCSITTQANCPGIWDQGGACSPNPCFCDGDSDCSEGECCIDDTCTSADCCVDEDCPGSPCEGDSVCADYSCVQGPSCDARNLSCSTNGAECVVDVAPIGCCATEDESVACQEDGLCVVDDFPDLTPGAQFTAMAVNPFVDDLEAEYAFLYWDVDYVADALPDFRSADTTLTFVPDGNFRATRVYQVLDTDGDGVPNGIDECPNTQPNVVVDDRGCCANGICGAMGAVSLGICMLGLMGMKRRIRFTQSRR